MKKVLLLALLATMAFASAYNREVVQFPDTILVGVDTLWSYPVSVKDVGRGNLLAATYKHLIWANDTCVLDAYFKMLDTADTTSMDSLMYSPWDDPKDSTVFTGYEVQTTAELHCGMIYLDVGYYIRIGLFLDGEVTDTVWVGHTIKDAFPTYAYLMTVWERQ